MKKNLFITTCILFCTRFALFPVFASGKTDEGPGYTASIQYEKQCFPGDPVFVNLTLTPVTKKYRKMLGQNLSATIKYFSNVDKEKALRTSELYLTNGNDQKRKSDVLTGAMPTSTFLECADYRGTVEFTAYDDSESTTIEFSFTVKPKDFVSETIKLNSKNTAIRTNTSDERKDQIDRLNKILDTKDSSGIWETGTFSYPTDATRRTSFFADRRIFAYSNGTSATSLHYGIDWGVPTGTNVAACGKGKVVMAEDRISTGWSVCIEHMPGLYSLYYHMSRLDVQVGQIVEKGQSLGLSGATGLATGPHIHWEVRLNMEAVDPEWFIFHSIDGKSALVNYSVKG